MSEPMEHIERQRPPWRTVRLTECGRLVEDVAVTIDRDAAVAKIKAQGKQRAAMSTCMACWDRAGAYQTWEESPAGIVSRDVGGYGFRNREDLLTKELRALAVLYEAHRDEYAAIVAGLAETSSLQEARSSRAARDHFRGGSR